MPSATTSFRIALAATLSLSMHLALIPAFAATPASSQAVMQDPVLQSRIVRVLDRLDDLFADDRKAAEGAPISAAKATALRREIQRLVLRSRTAGLPLDAVAEALQQAATDRFSGQIPGAFATETGELDARALIRGIVGKTRVDGTARAGDSYLSAISEEGSQTRIGARQGVMKETAPAATASVSGKPAAESEPAGELDSEAERAERQDTNSRVVTSEGRRYLVVQSGDTLGSIARDVYGDILLYRRIYEANRDKLTNPNVITLGTRLVIP